MEKNMICICCPKGCHLTYKDGEVTGNSCLRGLNYGKQEATNPTRIVTSTVEVNSKDVKVIPVKTNAPVPKNMIFKVMEEINKVKVNPPIAMNQVIIKDVLSLGVDIIATKEYLGA